jgi:UDP-glucose:(heptosyl)LPS alpha-1,3-glucosyltransferase
VKIALVTWHYDQHQGIARCVAELAERLARQQEVHVFATEWEHPEGAPIVFHRVPVAARRWYLMAASFFFTSARLLQRHRFDLVHLHAPSCCRAAVVTCHAVPAAALDHLGRLPPAARVDLPTRQLLPYRLLRPMYAFNYRSHRHRRVIAISSRIRDELIRTHGVRPELVRVIPHGVDLERFHPSHRARQGAAVRAELGIPGDSVVFLHVGYDFRRKGLGFAVRALARIPEGAARLLVVGPLGADGSYFERMIETLELRGRVVLAGLQKDVARFYAAADCLVFPSIYEPFGLVVLEAMASGLPVICSATVGCARDLITDRASGFLVDEPWEVERLALTMRGVVQDRALREEVGRGARRVATTCSWDRSVERTVEVYGQAVG